MQRLLDIIFSSSALLVFSPILIIISFILRLTGEGEVFFVQRRVGKGGKRFGLFKFATMLKNSPHIGTGTVTLKNDPRVLPVGRFLRKTKINELPQLLNILLGDMSVVGPRPQTERCFNAFPPDLQEVIMNVKPGLSGVGAIVFRGEEDLLAGDVNTVDFYDQRIAPYKGQIEAWYANHQTLFTYFAVIIVTVWVILFPSSSAVWRVFRDLPAPPDQLKSLLNYPKGLPIAHIAE